MYSLISSYLHCSVTSTHVNSELDRFTIQILWEVAGQLSRDLGRCEKRRLCTKRSVEWPPSETIHKLSDKTKPLSATKTSVQKLVIFLQLLFLIKAAFVVSFNQILQKIWFTWHPQPPWEQLYLSDLIFLIHVSACIQWMSSWVPLEEQTFLCVK